MSRYTQECAAVLALMLRVPNLPSKPTMLSDSMTDPLSRSRALTAPSQEGFTWSTVIVRDNSSAHFSPVSHGQTGRYALLFPKIFLLQWST
jgi:hypothetical protein